MRRSLPEENKIRNKAKRKVDEKIGVYIHIIASFAASVILVVLSFIVGNPFEPWLLFPLLPIFLAIFIHYSIVFGIPGTKILSEEWKEDQYDYEIWKLYRDSEDGINENFDEEELKLKEFARQKRSSWDENDLV